MQLFLHEKLSLNGKTEVKDANDVLLYKGKNGTFFNSKKIYLLNAEGERVVTIKWKNFFGNSYTIKKGKKKIATMKAKLSLINQKFKIKELGWDIKGNVTHTEYQITKNEEKVADIHKKSLIALMESYSVDIVNEDDALVVIAVLMVLNRVLGMKKKNLVNQVRR